MCLPICFILEVAVIHLICTDDRIPFPRYIVRLGINHSLDRDMLDLGLFCIYVFVEVCGSSKATNKYM